MHSAFLAFLSLSLFSPSFVPPDKSEATQRESLTWEQNKLLPDDIMPNIYTVCGCAKQERENWQEKKKKKKNLGKWKQKLSFMFIKCIHKNLTCMHSATRPPHILLLMQQLLSTKLKIFTLWLRREREGEWRRDEGV